MGVFLFFLVIFQLIAYGISWMFDVNAFGSLMLHGAAFMSANSAKKAWFEESICE